MKMTGEDIIGRICARLEDEGTLCYDSAIVGKLRTLDYYELQHLACLGDVAEWHNERVNKKRAATESDKV